MYTIKCKLVAYEQDVFDYVTYVFKSLEENPGFGHHYVMVTRLPHWDHGPIFIDDIGYLTYNEVEAGKDKWYCPETGQFVPYNYTNIYFVKFVKENKDNKRDIIL